MQVCLEAMIGSQAMELTQTIAGRDIGVPEILQFGYALFPTAIATSDSWKAHSSPEIVYMIEGEACWELENGQLAQLTGGQCALFGPNNAHKIANGIYPPCKAFWILLSDPKPSIVPVLLGPEDHASFEQDLGVLGAIRIVSERTHGAIEEIVRLMNDRGLYVGTPLLCSELRANLHLIFVDTWKAYRKEQNFPNTSNLVKQVLQSLHANDGKDISIASLARELGCSRGHLYNSFRRSIGMPPSDYAQRLRIKKSCEALCNPDSSITEIAYRNGFGSSQHFARVFRKYLGITPSGYRRQMQGR